LFFLSTLIRPGLSPQQQQRMAARSPGASLVPVNFDLSDANAKKVYVLGSFNGWRPQQYPMKFNVARQKWVIEIALPPGEYEYGFLVDSRRVIADPKAEFFKKDKFGSKNSILIVTPHDENRL
jgi:1,4-alpha-glucan branching enzyme